MYRVPGAGGALGAGALAFTGVDVTRWVLFGALLLVAGTMAILVSRRRRRFRALRDR